MRIVRSFIYLLVKRRAPILYKQSSLWHTQRWSNNARITFTFFFCCDASLLVRHSTIRGLLTLIISHKYLLTIRSFKYDQGCQEEKHGRGEGGILPVVQLPATLSLSQASEARICPRHSLWRICRGGPKRTIRASSFSSPPFSFPFIPAAFQFSR